MPRKIPRLLWLAIPMAYFLYFYRLGGAGMLGPDEPRYAAIARAMARSGDWVTPRLWSVPWFEKPPLLYWLQAPAFLVGLGPDLAPRLPVALLACAFLSFYWWMLRREFGSRASTFATLILAATACWIGYSQVGVTDLPLAATFSAAVLFALPWIARRDTRTLPIAAFMLGLAVLAKSLVPLALAAPLVLQFGKWRDLLRARVVLPFAAAALPWYAVCYWRNGRPFVDELFWKHQFARITSPALMHVQPWWFYLPVLIALVLPWSPLLPLAARAPAQADPRRRFLLAIVIWGVVVFSIALNKLPGYLLPLIPAAAALIGIALSEIDRARVWLAACAALLVVFPAAARVLPRALETGRLAHTPFPPFEPLWLAPLVIVATVWLLETRGRRLAAVACIAAATAAGAAYLKHATGAELARTPSARTVWSEVADRGVCLENLPRALEYSLEYYAGRALAGCSAAPQPLQIRQFGGLLYLTSAGTPAATPADPVDPKSLTGVPSRIRD